MYELANSFRQGWGVERDPVAARKYYEVAANLGDTDAMNEVARCFEEGFGGKKDKVSANILEQTPMFLGDSRSHPTTLRCPRTEFPSSYAQALSHSLLDLYFHLLCLKHPSLFFALSLNPSQSPDLFTLITLGSNTLASTARRYLAIVLGARSFSPD